MGVVGLGTWTFIVRAVNGESTMVWAPLGWPEMCCVMLGPWDTPMKGQTWLLTQRGLQLRDTRLNDWRMNE